MRLQTTISYEVLGTTRANKGSCQGSPPLAPKCTPSQSRTLKVANSIQASCTGPHGPSQPFPYNSFTKAPGDIADYGNLGDNFIYNFSSPLNLINQKLVEHLQSSWHLTVQLLGNITCSSLDSQQNLRLASSRPGHCSFDKARYAFEAQNFETPQLSSMCKFPQPCSCLHAGLQDSQMGSGAQPLGGPQGKGNSSKMCG